MAYGEPSGASARMNVLENVRYVPDGTEEVDFSYVPMLYRETTHSPGGARDLIIKWDPDPVGKTQPDGYVGATRWTIICSRGRDSIVNPVSPDSDSEV